MGRTVPIRYPPARADALVETLHGVPVADPDRWPEDPESPETLAWVDAENALTRATLDGPARDALVCELSASSTTPGRRHCSSGPGATFSPTPGLLNQPRLHVREDSGQEPCCSIPNTLSAAPAPTALTAIEPSPRTARRVVYALSEGRGSDRQVIRVREVRRPDRSGRCAAGT